MPYPMPDLDEFTEAYIAAAFFLSLDDNDLSLDEQWEPEQLTDEALASMIQDCKDFREIPEVAAALEAARNIPRNMEYNDGFAGNDFWLTRNHHGAGFWDRGLGDAGDVLTTWAHTFGSSDLYTTGNPEDETGQVHVS